MSSYGEIGSELDSFMEITFGDQFSDFGGSGIAKSSLNYAAGYKNISLLFIPQGAQTGC